MPAKKKIGALRHGGEGVRAPIHPFELLIANVYYPNRGPAAVHLNDGQGVIDQGRCGVSDER
jgi:hypothetical protein